MILQVQIEDKLTGDFLHQRAFTDYFYQRLAFVPFLVYITDVSGCVDPFERNGNGMMYALEPDCDVRDECYIVLQLGGYFFLVYVVCQAIPIENQQPATRYFDG